MKTAGHDSHPLSWLRVTLIAVASSSALAAAVQAAGAEGSRTPLELRYARAQALVEAASADLVLNESVRQHWTGRGSEFWYRRDRPDGADYVLFDRAGSKQPAFDHERLAASVAAAGAADAKPLALDLIALQPQVQAMVRIGDRTFACSLDNYTCAVAAAQTPEPTLLRSPDGKQAAFARDNDLWLRELGAGRETRLTNDGEPNYAWGKYPDAGLLSIPRQRSGLPFPPVGYSWSPDGRYLVGGRIDERQVEPYPFLESAPRDGSVRPKVWWVRQTLVGEPGLRPELAIFDTSTDRHVPVTGLVTEIAGPSGPGLLEIVGWNAANTRFYGLQAAQYGRELRLIEVDALTGAARTVLVERSATQALPNVLIYSAPNVRIIKGGREAIWFSERSGWGHLYRYDIAGGRLLGAITRGTWVVCDIIHVDEARRRIYFTALGREPGDPYQRRLYRVDFDGSALTLLTPEDADHQIDGAPTSFMALFGTPAPPQAISPDGRAFVDAYSTLDAPPRTVVRSTQDGRVISRIEDADASKLYAAGWRPPEPFVAKAADGKTDLYGVIYWPENRAAGPLPVIDALYAGPQVIEAPHNFPDAHGRRSPAPFAELGFVTVVIDGRGTPFRSRAFQDVGYGNFADPALDDHVAVLRELGKRYPQMDLDRVGVTGHSFGGYVSARALLRYPDFYKVGVSSAGSHNFQGMYVALYPPNYGNGVTTRPSPSAVPENYRILDNASLAANLKGKLLLAYGDLDENAYPAVTLQFIDALIKAGRNYDLLYLPNRTHNFAEPYFTRRRWDYFVEHLLGQEPPQP